MSNNSALMREELPLHAAVTNNSLDDMKTLLDQDTTDINVVGTYGLTPLLRAIGIDFDLAVSLLLERGSNVNVKDTSGNSALHYATYNKDEKYFKILLVNGADIDSKGIYNQTPLHIAASMGSQSYVDLLLEKGANINAGDDEGNTPLHFALMTKTIKLSEKLLDRGANTECKGRDGETPLHVASKHTFDGENVSLLLERGANPNALNNFGQTPLHSALQNRRDYSLTGLQTLLHWGASPFVADNRGFTPLQMFSEFRYVHEPIFEQHLMKLKYVNWLSEGSYEFDMDRFSSCHEACLKESARLKAKKYGLISLYDVFTKYNDPTYVTNEDMEIDIKCFLQNEFPIYLPLLKATYARAVERFSLLNLAQSYLTILVEKLPNEMIRKILSYLDSQDLKNFIEANEGPGSEQTS